jgi:hypothetical protein
MKSTTLLSLTLETRVRELIKNYLYFYFFFVYFLGAEIRFPGF